MTNTTLSNIIFNIIIISVLLTQCVSKKRTDLLQITSTVVDNVTISTEHNSNQTQLNNSSSNNSNINNNDTNQVLLPRGKPLSDIFKNNSAILRAVYVACGFVVIVIVYNVIMTRLRRKKNKLQMYGLLKSHSDVEMTPLDREDDEETTMFDASVFKNTRG